MSRFVNKVALITGGASGIGAAVGHRIAIEGARVALVDFNREKLKEQKNILTEKGFNVTVRFLLLIPDSSVGRAFFWSIFTLTEFFPGPCVPWKGLSINYGKKFWNLIRLSSLRSGVDTRTFLGEIYCCRRCFFLILVPYRLDESDNSYL